MEDWARGALWAKHSQKLVVGFLSGVSDMLSRIHIPFVAYQPLTTS